MVIDPKSKIQNPKSTPAHARAGQNPPEPARAEGPLGEGAQSEATYGKASKIGTIVRLAGLVVVATGLDEASMYDVVQVGHLKLSGEIIRLDGNLATIQVYEETDGLGVGEPVVSRGNPFEVELGPGLIGAVFDGVQRPLPVLRQQQGDFIARGGTARALDREKAWAFEPQVQVGDEVSSGDSLGIVSETPHLEHHILVPPGLRGVVEKIGAGQFTVEQTVAVIRNEENTHKLTLIQRWPVREPRPHQGKLDPTAPLITGQRVVDAFFPVAKGGTAIIPGGFGAGKTVLEQTLAKWADADIIVYIGCGERGNEMTEVLDEFPKLEDPYTGDPLMNRTILIANTSNMPVAAREASIYTGLTMAEYYRDMGYDVAVLADSTSRWGEALREISGRLEEMPSEEGYPAYLVSRLAGFYERGGRVQCAGSNDRVGSVTLVGAVSPPGGDFSEPMTQNSMRVTGAFWALDTDLARRRHFPAINWSTSYSLYDLDSWFNQKVAEDWAKQNQRARSLLQRESELQEIVQLVGAEALAETERAELAVGRLLREDLLQQSAFGEDAFCPPEKTYWMLNVILTLYDHILETLKQDVSLEQIQEADVLAEVARMREWPPDEAPDRARELLERIETTLKEMQEG
jgi:V/A-type H+-transporting ATPase subunit A